MVYTAQEILGQLTLEEKASLCSGKNFWELKGIERLGLPSIMVTDGPHGLRKQAGDADHLGINKSIEATCFPTASATATSWNVELMREMGEALGEECLAEQVSVLLGPGANIKRSPLCGRNFEYISEDPYHTGEMAAALINGVQSKGVGTSLKHFAANNQEKLRLIIDSEVDERALREIYLAGFETAVKKAQPWTVMCAYNKLNGTYCSENKKLLTDILKEEWGHTGLVVTDWGAINDRVEGIRAGLELEMPGSNGVNDKKIVEAVKNGTLSEELLDKAVIRLLELIIKSYNNKQEDATYNKERHHELARKIAGESMVLLKNEEQILPLKEDKKIAVIGALAKHNRYQGSGSSQINPTKLENAHDSFKAWGISIDYAKGYEIDTDEMNATLIEEACEVAKNNETVVMYVGLTERYESEGYDRDHMQMPENQNALIEAVTKVNPNVVIVLLGGAPVEMPWINDVKAVLNAYLTGQAGGVATLDILYGRVNPSGKLAETYPITLKDNPSYNYFPGGKRAVEYRESIYVGYRYYDTAKKEVLFPFGYGLSYTTFEYSDLQIEKSEMKEDEELLVSLKVKNTGDVAGAEIVQLYVSHPKATIFKAEKELKEFDKVYLQPGEEKVVTFKLNKRSFAYYNVNIKDWHVETGEYIISVGASSRDIRLTQSVKVISLREDVVVPNYRYNALGYYKLQNKPLEIDKDAFEAVYGKPLEPIDGNPSEPYTMNTPLADIASTQAGAAFISTIKEQMTSMVGGEDDSISYMMEKMFAEMPLRSIALFAGDKMSEKQLQKILTSANMERES